MIGKIRIFFGWRIVGASMIVLAVAMGMYFSTNSLFVIPVCDSLGVSRSQFTLYRTIITLASAATMPFYAKTIRRLGVKKPLLIGAVALGMVNICYSFANQLWHFYALAILNGIFAVSVHFMAIGILISDWFIDQRGIATSLAYSGSGLGGAIMIPVVSHIIELAGWRFAYRFMGLLGLAVMIPVILFLVKDKPETVGLEPYTLPGAKRDGKKKAESPAFHLSFREACQTNRFWLLSIGFFLISMFASAVNTHSTPFLLDIGYPIVLVSSVISLFMVFLTVGKIILGVAYDRFGTLAGNIIIALCCLIFPVAALLAHIPIFPWIYAVMVGIASSGASVPTPIIIARYFGTRDYPMIYSMFTMITTLGSSISVPAMGAVYDYSGSYRPAWIALLISSVIISVCIVAAEFSFRTNAKRL